MLEVRVRVPVSIRGELLANVLGVLGLLGIVVCVGGLLGPWVAGLLGSLMLVGLAWVAHTNAAASPAAAPAARPVTSVEERAA